MKEETIEVIEVWEPVESGGEAVRFGTTNGKGNLKRIALIVGGTPLFLEKDYFIERREITKEEAKKLTTPKE
ncbi:MAG: hypothetical protein HY376_01890 [Candidatus Blackburnbacteria bacterium]|nr:hypothetical protein [Candidatus Blackburnbacteria bacterium]